MRNLQEAMKAAGGVARVHSLRARGFSRFDIEKALAAGTLIRVRRGWVASLAADNDLVLAAGHNVVLTCVTAASRLGLWVDSPRRHHVAARPHSSELPPELTVHWAAPAVPRQPDALVDPVENVLALVAECQPFEQALATWESALRKDLVTTHGLARLRLKPAARAVLAEAAPFADSGLETYVRIRLQWLRLPIRTQTWIAGHRVDLLIGDRLIVQIDGATHTGKQRDSDTHHDAELTLLGFHVLRVSYRQVMEQWHVVQDQIMRCIAQSLHLAA